MTATLDIQVAELIAKFPPHTIVTDGHRCGMVVSSTIQQESNKLWLVCCNAAEGQFWIDPDRAQVLDTIEQFEVLLGGDLLGSLTESAWSIYKEQVPGTEETQKHAFFTAFGAAAHVSNNYAAVLVQMLGEKMYETRGPNMAVWVGQLLHKHRKRVVLVDVPPVDPEYTSVGH